MNLTKTTAELCEGDRVCIYDPTDRGTAVVFTVESATASQAIDDGWYAVVLFNGTDRLVWDARSNWAWTLASDELDAAIAAFERLRNEYRRQRADLRSPKAA